jgi:hypothetical protein
MDVISRVDVAVRDSRLDPQPLVMFGNVEIKDPRNRWSFPQFVGQLVGQASYNFNANYREGDGSIG